MVEVCAEELLNYPFYADKASSRKYHVMHTVCKMDFVKIRVLTPVFKTAIPENCTTLKQSIPRILMTYTWLLFLCKQKFSGKWVLRDPQIELLAPRLDVNS